MTPALKVPLDDRLHTEDAQELSVLSISASERASSYSPTFSAYLELTKPRIVTMIVITAAIGYYLGGNGIPSWFTFISFLLGTAVSCGGAGVLNNYLERDIDSMMKRTSKRPLPVGTVHPVQALGVGVLMSLVGTVFLVYAVSLLSGFLALLTVFLYVLVYTPLKRVTWLNTMVGAVPGALPPLGGWAAATGHVGAPAWVLFLILFVWQHPHFFAIAWMYREDYKRGGLKMLPVVDPDGNSTFRQILWYSIAMIPVAALPHFFEMAGDVYLVSSILLSMVLLIFSCIAIKTRTNLDAKYLLRATIVYLPVLLILIVCDPPR